ncbi:heme ABC transporter ATP-binding protein [Achromobacter sp. AGC39]
MTSPTQIAAGQAQAAKAQAAKAQAAQTQPAPRTAGQATGGQALAAHRLTLSRGGARILTDVSLEVRPGEVVGLLGANGAGKSTLLGALAAELSADAGQITLDGAPLAGMVLGRQARRRAVLPQKPGLTFDLGVREVVAMGAYPFAELAPAQVDALVAQALGLADVAHLAGRRYPELSGGEQQRVQFARVLVQCHAARAPGEARYLLLDEPTASLDPKHQGDLLHRAWELAHEGNTGVLVILHDMNLAARWCDRLLLLSAGRAIAQGTPAQVLTAANLYRAYGIEAQVIAHPLQPDRLLVLTV